MKQLTYNNINCNFTFELVCSKLIQFWKEEVIILKKNKKIWLTITIVNENNRSFKLIKNLPFYVSDFTDITIVLKQIFDSNILSNRKEKLDSITFQYYIENNNKKLRINFKEYIINILLFIITVIAAFSLTIISFNLFLDAYQEINYDYISDQVLNYVDENLDIRVIKEPVKSIKTPKYCVFDPFIRLFDSGETKYVASKFLPSNLKIDKNDFNLLEYIIYNQYMILDYAVSDWNQLIRDLNEILQQYQSITNNLLV